MSVAIADAVHLEFAVGRSGATRFGVVDNAGSCSGVGHRCVRPRALFPFRFDQELERPIAAKI